MKKLFAAVISTCMLLTSFAAVRAAELPFKDVPKDAWYFNDVKTAYESGVINGKSDTEYKPKDNMTYAEAIKLAACMNMLAVKGAVNFEKGDPWYAPYVDYCMEKGIISKTYDFSQNVSRSGYMEIFAKCLPDEMLKDINSVADNSIPDVPGSASYAAAVYKLYRAGIVTGVDEAHNCNPAANIQRSEVAAILTRMNNKDARIEFTMGETEEDKDKDEDDKDKTDETEKKDETDKTEEETKPVKPLSVKTVPDEANISLDEDVELKAIVSGGKAPYTYEWNVAYRMVGKAIQAREERFGINTQEAFDAGFPEAELSDNTMTFKVDDKAFFNQFSSVRCTVTDADGSSQTVIFKLKYAGLEGDNDLATDTFLMYVEDRMWIEGRGLVATGRIENGSVKLGDALKLMKTNGKVETVKVEGIEMFHKMLDQAKKGDNVGLLLSGLGNDSETARAKIARGEALIGYNDKLASTQVIYADVRMYTKEEGGLKNPVAGDGTYEPQLYIGMCDYTVILENWVWDYEEGEESHPDLVPGESYEDVTIIMKAETSYFVPYIGQTGYIREGGKNIGEITVKKVFVK